MAASARIHEESVPRFTWLDQEHFQHKQEARIPCEIFDSLGTNHGIPFSCFGNLAVTFQLGGSSRLLEAFTTKTTSLWERGNSRREKLSLLGCFVSTSVQSAYTNVIGFCGSLPRVRVVWF